MSPCDDLQNELRRPRRIGGNHENSMISVSLDQNIRMLICSDFINPFLIQNFKKVFPVRGFAEEACEIR